MHRSLKIDKKSSKKMDGTRAFSSSIELDHRALNQV